MRDEWGQPASSELELFLQAEPKWESCVLVAGTLGKRAAQQRAELDDLKRRGFAE